MLAVLLGLLPVLAVLTTPAAAQNANVVNNLAVLNTALSMSNMNSAFFNCFLAPNNVSYASACNSISPMAMGFTSNHFLDAGYPQNVYDAMVALANQEANVASFLTSAINSASPGAAYPPCRRYTFGNTTSVVTYLQNGMRLMANTLSFFNGGLNGLADPGLTTVMARIGSVKGRHTAFLSNLVNQSFVAGTMNGFDIAASPAVANASTAAYQLDCSNIPWSAPTIRPYGVSRSGSNGTAYTGPMAQAANVIYGDAARANDIAAMNYFLTIENLAVNLFANITGKFTSADFTTAGFTPAVYAAVQQMANDDRGHVSTYSSLIPAYGGTPMQNCTYNFSSVTQTVNGSLAFASAVVNLGTQAYNGRLNAITDTLFQQAAATAATVHSRHSAILNLIQAGWTGAFITGNQTAHAVNSIDNALVPSDVLTAVVNTGVLGACPMTIPQPGEAPAVVFGGSSSSTGMFNYSSSSAGNSASQIGVSAVLLIAALPMFLF